MRADVTVMDLDLKRLAQIDQIFAGNVKTLASSEYEIEKEVTQADLVIGAVLVHGAKAPKLVSNDLVKKMKPGSVLVDVAIDQGGCFTDSRQQLIKSQHLRFMIQSFIVWQICRGQFLLPQLTRSLMPQLNMV